MTFTHALSTNNYGSSKFIVDSSAANGTHTTIASALTSASSGDTIFIRPGTYTENLTLKAGVNLVAYSCDAFTPNVIILGKATLTAAGTVSISGIQLKTNSDFFLAVTGTAASNVVLNNCFLNCNNNTGISFTTSDATATIVVQYCRGNLATTGIGYWSMSSAGTLGVIYSSLSNSGVSVTASSNSAGIVFIANSSFNAPLSTSSTGVLNVQHAILVGGTNVTMYTTAGTGGGTLTHSHVDSGSSATVSIGAGTLVNLNNNNIFSTNTNPVTGAGSVTFGINNFGSTGSGVNVTTITPVTSRYGISQSTTQPAFLATTGDLTNKVGAGTPYVLGTDAMTEIYDQNSNFNTNGTFTAPLTGRYQQNYNCGVTGNTIATAISINMLTSNRTYNFNYGRGASALNLSACVAQVTDMDAADTTTYNVNVTGEAGVTSDILGIETYVSALLAC